jgi:hypothetical protein
MEIIDAAEFTPITSAPPDYRALTPWRSASTSDWATVGVGPVGTGAAIRREYFWTGLIGRYLIGVEAVVPGALAVASH